VKCGLSDVEDANSKGNSDGSANTGVDLSSPELGKVYSNENDLRGSTRFETACFCILLPIRCIDGPESTLTLCRGSGSIGKYRRMGGIEDEDI